MESVLTNDSMKVSGEHVKCPSCAAEMVYSPEEGALVCPYCGSHLEIEASSSPIEEHILNSLKATRRNGAYPQR